MEVTTLHGAHGNKIYEGMLCLPGKNDYTIDLCAGVAELVDAPDSKSGSREGVSVRFRPSVPFTL
jgi:hypothetical protein